MKALLLLLVILALGRGQVPIVGTDYQMLDVLPGLDFVGFGYDTRFDSASTALQVPIFDFSYSQGKQFAYPTLPGLTYQVPDEVYIRNVAFTEANAYLYNSLSEYTTALALNVGIDVSTLTGTTQTNATCLTSTQGNATTTNCTQVSQSSADNLFSIGSTVGFIKNSFQSQESYLVENSEKTQLYHIFLDARYIRAEVKEDLRVLSNYLFDDNRILYIKFLEKYGTHYVVSATMGGQVTMMSSIAQSTTSLSNTVTVGVNATTTVSKQNALASATSSFTSTLAGQVDFSYSSVNSNIQLQTTSQWTLLGGNSSIVNLLDTRNATDAIKSWKGTITENPVPVGFRLVEVSTLFDDPYMRDQMHTAIRVFLTVDTSDTVQLQNFNPPPIPGVTTKRSNPVFDIWNSMKAQERAAKVAQ